MLTRKHYKKIAEILDTNQNKAFGHLSRDVIYDLADYFKKDNPKFNRDKFIEAVFDLPKIK